MQAAAQGWQRQRGLKERKQRRDAGAWRGGYRAGRTESRSIGERDLAKGGATKDLALSRTTASGQGKLGRREGTARRPRSMQRRRRHGPAVLRRES